MADALALGRVGISVKVTRLSASCRGSRDLAHINISCYHEQRE